MNPRIKAKEILKTYGVETRADTDVVKIARHLGLKVYKADLPEGISGVLEPTSTGGNIYVKEGQVEERQRFSIAHELGHYCLEHFSAIHVDRSLLFRDKKSEEAVSRIEIEANSFAAELLMPADKVKRKFNAFIKKKYVEDEIIDKLACIFKVSILAMSYRLINLQLTNTN